MPHVLMDTLMFEHGVCYGQTVTSTEVQQGNTTLVQIREAIPPNQVPPGTTDIAQMSIEVPQQNKGVLIWGTFQHPRQGLQEGWVVGSPTQRQREPTLSSTGENPNVQAPSWGPISKPTSAHRLSPWAMPEYNKVQPLLRRLVPGLILSVKVSLTISSRYRSTLGTS